MKSTNLKSLTGFRYANRMLTAGDEFTATNAHGRLLVALGKAEYLTKSETPQQPRTGEVATIKPTAKGRKPRKELKE